MSTCAVKAAVATFFPSWPASSTEPEPKPDFITAMPKATAAASAAEVVVDGDPMSVSDSVTVKEIPG